MNDADTQELKRLSEQLGVLTERIRNVHVRSGAESAFLSRGLAKLETGRGCVLEAIYAE